MYCPAIPVPFMKTVSDDILSKSSMKTRHKNLIKFIFVLAILYFVGNQITQNWDELVRYDWTFNPGWFVLSIIAQLATFIMFSKVWCVLVHGFGYQVPLRYGFKIGYIANLGRYIPGKIWQVLGMTYYAKQIDMSEEAAVTSWIIATTLGLPAAFLASLAGIIFFPQVLLSELDSTMRLGVFAIAVATFLMSAVLIVLPTRSLALLNLLLKKVGRGSLEFHLSSGLAFRVYAGYFACWIMYGVSFWMFLHAILPDPKIGVVEAATAFILAYQLGYVAFLAPGGIGVRELVLTGALMPFVGPIASGVAVAARFWSLVIEILAALIALNIKIKDRENNR